MIKLQSIFSVTEFNQMINQHLSLLGEVIVEGEISELNISQNRFLFATIKDEQSNLSLFGLTFKLFNLEAIEVGMKVKVCGVPNIFQKSGRFNLHIHQISPSGEGALKIAYEKLKNKLTKEGLFDEAKKRNLPMFPQSVGLITAKDSQAYKDFIKIVNEITGGLKIQFYPVTVQRDQAVGSITKALDYFNQKHQTDVLVLTRGGGSIEDLSAFNDEALVRKIHTSKIPTICAIGHEGDITLAELTADLRASTPSNAAQLLIRNSQEVVSQINYQINLIESKINQQIYQQQTQVKESVQILNNFFNQAFNQLFNLKKDLINSFSNQITRYQDQVEFLSQKLKSLDYQNILKRGFSIAKTASNQIIKSINQVKLKDKVDLILIDGQLNTKVINKKKG